MSIIEDAHGEAQPPACCRDRAGQGVDNETRYAAGEAEFFTPARLTSSTTAAAA